MIVLVLFAVLASSRAPSCSSLLSCAIVVESGARGVQQHLSAGLFLLVLLERLAILFTIQNVITHEFECVTVICVVLLLSVLTYREGRVHLPDSSTISSCGVVLCGKV